MINEIVVTLVILTEINNLFVYVGFIVILNRLVSSQKDVFANIFAVKATGGFRGGNFSINVQCTAGIYIMLQSVVYIFTRSDVYPSCNEKGFVNML